MRPEAAARLRGATAVPLVGAALLLLCGCAARSTPVVPSSTPIAVHTATAPPLPVVGDTGPRTHATGRAVRIPGHVPFRQLRYTVAPGDTLVGIDERFHMCRDDFQTLDSGFDAYSMPVGLQLVLGRPSDAPFTDACA